MTARARNFRLNGKGKPLTAADLIKAFVCGKSIDGAGMAAVWQDRVLPLGSDATSALLDIARAATGDVSSEAKLFKLFERSFPDTITPALLGGGAAAYERAWRTSLDDFKEMDGPTRRRLRGLRKLDRRDHSSLLVSMAAVYKQDIPLDPVLVRALEAYQLWMAIRGKRGRERDFTALASHIYKARPPLPDAMRAVGELLKRLAPTAAEARTAVASAAYPGRTMKFILTQYEEGMRGDVQVDDVWFEHMMPQTWTNYWRLAAKTTDENQYSRIVNNIGNLAPLDQKTDIVGGNSDWSTKRALYRKCVPNWLLSRIADDNPDGWTPEKIQARASTIAEWAVSERWNLDQALAAL